MTFRLADSIPIELQRQWLEELDVWMQWHPEPWTHEVELEYRERFPKRIEQWLDAGMGDCHLRRTDVRAAVEDHLCHFDGQRSDLDFWVLMPNHVHCLLVPQAGYQLFDLLKGIKGTSARTCNAMLGRTGSAFWMEDSYNRIVRDREELAAFRRYIAHNPIKAKLEPHEYTLACKEVLE